MCLHSNMQNNNKRQHEMFAQKVPWKATVIVPSSELLRPFFLNTKEGKKKTFKLLLQSYCLNIQQPNQ